MRRERKGQSVEEASDDSFKAPVIRKRLPTSRDEGITVESRKRHCCNFEGCSKAYMRLEHLTRHQLNHLGTAMHCKYCEKTFTRNDLLQRHIHRHERSDCTNKRSLRHKTPILAAPSEVKREVAQTSRVSAGHMEHPFVRPTLENTALDLTVETSYTAQSPNGAVDVFMPQSNAIFNPSPTRSFPAMSAFAQPAYDTANGEDDSIFSPPAKRQHLSTSDTIHTHEDLAQPALVEQDTVASGICSWSAATIIPQVLSMHREVQPPVNGIASAFSNDPNAIDWKWMIGANNLFEEPVPPPSVYSQFGSSVDSPGGSHGEHSVDLCISQEQIVELLKLLPSEISADSWLLPHNIQQAVTLALDSLESAIPMLHRPTLVFNSTNVDLLLVVVTYGLLIQALQPDTWQIGLQLHAVARRRIHHPDLLANRADLPFLQAMLLHEITGTYLGSRGEHERADIVHGQLVRLATRSDILWTMSEEPANAPSSTQEQKWRDWVHRESTKRLAHFVFALDVQHVVHFNHTSVLTIDDMNLMLPCADELWKAPTAAHWRAARSRLVNHQSESASKLRAAVEAMVVRDVAVIDRQQFSPLQMYVIVHGLLSVVTHHVGRRAHGGGVFSRCRGSQAVAEIWTERVALDEALAYYELVLNDLHGAPPSPGEAEDALLANARRYCRLARSYLHISPQDIEMAAGSLYSGGKVVLRERAQEAIRGLASQVITLAQCEDALLIIQDLCCEGGSVLLNGATIGAKELAVPSMLYSAALFVWAFLLSVKRERGLMTPLQLSSAANTANDMTTPIAGYQLSSPQDHVSLHAQLSTPPNAVCAESEVHANGTGSGTGADCGAADGVYVREQCALLREHARLGDIQALDGAVQRLLRCCFARMAYSRSAIVAEQRLVIMKLSHDTSVPPT